MGPRTGLDVCEKFASTGIRSPDRPDKIKNNQYIGWEAVAWIGLAQDRDKWRSVVKAVVSLWVP